jgi:hypothetical protein
MTEPFPSEPTRAAGSAPVPPPPATPSAAPVDVPLEQPLPAQSVPVARGSVRLWAILAGLLIVGGMTALIGGAFWYAQNYSNDLLAEGQSADAAPQNSNKSDDVFLNPQNAGAADRNNRSSTGSNNADNEEQRREQQARRQAAASRQREEAARRQGQVIAFRTSTKKIQQDLDALLGVTTAWQTKVATLLQSAPGRRIAGSAPHVERFVAVYEKKRLSKSDVATLQARLDTLLRPLKSAEKDADETYVPSKSLTDDVQTLAGEIRTALRQYLQDLLAVEGLLENTAKSEPSKATLQAAITAFHRAEASQRAATVAAARRKARQEADRQLADAEAAKIAAENRVKLLKIKAKKAEAEGQEKALAAEIEAAAKKREAAQKKAALTRQFEREYPTMRGYLIPFTSSGFAQPGGRGYTRTTEKGPVSFSKLQGAGYLKKTIGSLKSFYYSTTANRMNDRPGGAFPNYIGGAGDWGRRQETIQSIQDFLNKYGTILVEKKLLAP